MSPAYPFEGRVKCSPFRSWYAGDQKSTHDVPLMTSQQGAITQDRVADVGFELNAEQAFDDDVLQHVENHTHFKWSKAQ